MHLLKSSRASSSRASSSLEKIAKSIVVSQKYDQDINQTVQMTQVMTQHIFQAFQASEGPMTSFEISSSFFPEQYSMAAISRRVHIFDWSEDLCSSAARVDEYHL
jgi:hypothetical protein